jgi:hypothetical protein
MKMKQSEIQDAIGKEVVVNGACDLGINPDLRQIVGQTCTLVKVCRNGLLLVQHGKRQYSVPQRNVDLKPEGV